MLPPKHNDNLAATSGFSPNAPVTRARSLGFKRKTIHGTEIGVSSPNGFETPTTSTKATAREKTCTEQAKKRITSNEPGIMPFGNDNNSNEDIEVAGFSALNSPKTRGRASGKQPPPPATLPTGKKIRISHKIKSADEYEKLLKRMHEGWIKDADPPIISGYAAHAANPATKGTPFRYEHYNENGKKVVMELLPEHVRFIRNRWRVIPLTDDTWEQYRHVTRSKEWR